MIAINALFKADSDKKDDSPLSPFASFSPFVGNEKEETELSITFNIGKKVYEYTVSFDNLNKVIAREIFTLTDKNTREKNKKRNSFSGI